MATHLAAYLVSDYGKTLVELSVVKDDVLTQTSPTRFMVPVGMNNVHFGYAAGANLTEAYLQSPSLQVRRHIPRIIPGNYGALNLDLNKILVWKPIRPLTLSETEELSVIATYGGTANAYNLALVALGPAALPPVPAGEIRMIKLTSSTTLTAGAWTTCVMTPEVALEVGTYALVGFLPISAGALAARAIFTGQYWRPGVPAIAGSDPGARAINDKYLKDLQFYEMGRFTHTTLPMFQFLSQSADTAETVYAYIVKVA